MTNPAISHSNGVPPTQHLMESQEREGEKGRVGETERERESGRGIRGVEVGRERGKR